MKQEKPMKINTSIYKLICYVAKLEEVIHFSSTGKKIIAASEDIQTHGE